MDANDPAAIEARADNDDYDDHPTPPPPPPQSRPLPLPPSLPTDLDFRSRDVGEGLTDDEGGRRQEVEGHGMELDLMRRDNMDTWTTTTDETAPTLGVGNVDSDNRCEYIVLVYVTLRWGNSGYISQLRCAGSSEPKSKPRYFSCPT